MWAKLYIGDALEVSKTFKPDSVDMIMTSPPYWGLRDYKVNGQLGLESTSDEYIRRLVEYLDELKRVIKPTGSMYVNLGDTYMKKNLQMIPARVALSLQESGWILRNDIIWHKPNHMPASVKDRLTNSYEHLFHFVKSKKYYFDLNAIRVPHKTGPSPMNRLQTRGLKTKGKAQVSREQHHGQDIIYHPKGRNPGDVIGYKSKFNRKCQASNLLTRTAFARKVLGYDHETALNHPLGKNPGDVMQYDSHWASRRDNCCMPAFPPQHADKITRGYREGRGVADVNPDIQNHPLGKNPGDVVFALNHARMRGQSGEARTNLYQPDRIKYHKLGKNPGDVICFENHSKIHQLFLDTKGRIGHGHYKGGIFIGIHNHPLGKNPGDVIYFDEPNKYKGNELLRRDKRLGGKVGLAEFREQCRSKGIVESHPSGKNPGDVLSLVSETRSKDKLLRQRRRDLAEMRQKGRIHWNLHPSKDPRWFNIEGKNPTDFWEIKPKPFPGAHFAVYPETLCITPIKSSCPPGGVVLDPFAGSGTTLKVALELRRRAIGIELNPKYAMIMKDRIHQISVIRH